jgi:small subunit ribosomal protein S18
MKTTYKKNTEKLNTEQINYKNIEQLKNFINEQGKILPRRRTKLSTKQHRQISKAIKKARIVSLLPFITGGN